MKRIVFLFFLAVSALNLFAYGEYAEIIGREPNYVFSNSWNFNMPIYLGFDAYSGVDSLGLVNVKPNSNGKFDTIKVNGQVVMSFDSSVSSAEINLNNYVSRYLDDMTHMLELYNGNVYQGKLYFGSHLPEKGGCLLFCPDEPFQATVVGFNPNATEIYVPEEFWVTEEWCMPVDEIARLAFHNATKMESIVIPSTLKIIESNAFEGCINLVMIKK